MKKVIFVIFVLAAGLCSCSQSDDNNSNEPDFVDVTIGTDSGDLTGKSGAKSKSIVEPGGTTSWNLNDKVNVVDVDGSVRTFTYADETPKSSAKFAGKLLGNQGKSVYKAFHAPEKSKVELESGHILVIEREDLDITESGIVNNSALFGSYCPMISIPIEFNAGSSQDNKAFRFYHLASMIEGRVTLRENEEMQYLDKLFDKVTFEVQAKNSTPFYKKVELDMNKLTTNSKIEDINECFINQNDPSAKTDYMYTIMNMNVRTIRELMQEYESLGSFPIPIFALPTGDGFDYTATICFYHGATLQLKMQGSATATRLNPMGLNVLDFDYEKIVTN